MSLTELCISGYRSLRRLVLPMRPLTVVTGPNGSGKSNLYRALWLISQVCEGGFAKALAREGGFLSALWAGPRLSKDPIRMSLGLRTEDLGFELIVGFPKPNPLIERDAFCYDPEIKEEAVWFGRIRKPSTLFLDRQAGCTRIRDQDGHTTEYRLTLSENESVLSQLREPHKYPELLMLRESVRGWRFYHHFRTDDEAPCRQPQISVQTPILSHDGSDLAAALETILVYGNSSLLRSILEEAFPGRELKILPGEELPYSKSPRYTELSVAFEVEGCARWLLARELSDGTLRFLCLAAALLSVHTPPLIALNEPESSLHPDLLPALARLIVDASQRTQVWVTTHSQPLVQAIRELSGVRPIVLKLFEGQTIIEEDLQDQV